MKLLCFCNLRAIYFLYVLIVVTLNGPEQLSHRRAAQ